MNQMCSNKTQHRPDCPFIPQETWGSTWPRCRRLLLSPSSPCAAGPGGPGLHTAGEGRCRAAPRTGTTTGHPSGVPPPGGLLSQMPRSPGGRERAKPASARADAADETQGRTHGPLQESREGCAPKHSSDTEQASILWSDKRECRDTEASRGLPLPRLKPVTGMQPTAETSYKRNIPASVPTALTLNPTQTTCQPPKQFLSPFSAGPQHKQTVLDGHHAVLFASENVVENVFPLCL